jgi:sec-independent protein translocase protein TatA
MHLLVIFGIALLVFGPKKLPELGKGIGEGIRGFKSAMKDEEKPANVKSHHRGRLKLTEVNRGLLILPMMPYRYANQFPKGATR